MNIPVRPLLLSAVYTAFVSFGLKAQNTVEPLHPGPVGSTTLLPNGWSLSPAGTSLPLSSDLPLQMALAPDGVHVAVTNNGNGKQTIDLINLEKGQVTDSVSVHAAWLGLAFSTKQPYLYASGGNDDIILRLEWKSDHLSLKDTLVLGRPWPKDKISPTGLTLDDEHHLLYVVTKEDDALYICDTRTMKVITKIFLGSEAYTCLLHQQLLYISAWGGKKIWIVDTDRRKVVDSVSTEDHPTDMAIDPKGKWLYVANANSNFVSVISLKERKAVETLHTAIAPDAPIGSTTNSVSLDPSGKTLYIANADNNYLAVFDVTQPGHSQSKGFIPVGWYPTCVRVLNHQILVTNGKGMSSMANPHGPHSSHIPYDAHYKQSGGPTTVQYIGDLFKGTFSVIPVPSAKEMETYTQQVYANTPYNKNKEISAPGLPGNPIPTKASDSTPIKYVFYILRENRTYDQVLGDMPQGNGDTSLVLFGQNITPNAHALSQEFVLLDNFYVDAEVSADGHNWSMAAYATDFVEKNWPSNYSGRGGNYDFDGSRPVANPTNGFIWDYCARAGVSLRNYGEFMDSGTPTLKVLKAPGNYCHYYPGWNLRIQDTYREKQFEHDFDSLVAIGAVPHFNTVYLPNDHTSGLAIGAYTPQSLVADNDQALGRLVDHISHSPIWKESAIFVLEDDAQDGPDHVDAHRSVALVISPYVRRNKVNHTMYSTSSMLRTMELILGLPPMSQYDAAATPMYDLFASEPDTSAYQARQALIDINARNTTMSPGALKSAHFDLSKADAVPDAELNEVLWKAIKGEGKPVPAPRRSAFVKVLADKDDD
jgi:DNA-binding beta-propeller fold protein YncE